jgi:hypothetical protein
MRIMNPDSTWSPREQIIFLCCSKVNKSGTNGNVNMSGCGMTTLTVKEVKRLEIIQRVFRGELTVVEAG